MGVGDKPVVVTGAEGLLGRAVVKAFAAAGRDVRGLSRSELDVTDADQVQACFERRRPGLVVHCAALTDVDRCELEPALAEETNVKACEFVGRSSAEHDAAILAISTDYVFDGRRGAYAEDDETGPIQVYGRTKLAGEQAVRDANPNHLIVRSAWIFGAGGKSFLSRLPELARQASSLDVVVDQRSSPTYAPDLATALVSLVAKRATGTFHVTNSGACSYFEFVSVALALLGCDVRVEEVTRSDLRLAAARPRDTSLVSRAWAEAGLAPLRDWERAAEAFLSA